MKRDFDLIREILITLENEPNSRADLFARLCATPCGAERKIIGIVAWCRESRRSHANQNGFVIQNHV